MNRSNTSCSSNETSILTAARKAGHYADRLECGRDVNPSVYRLCMQLVAEEVKKVIAFTGGPLPQRLGKQSPALREIWENLMFEKHGSFQASSPGYLHAKQEATALLARAAALREPW